MSAKSESWPTWSGRLAFLTEVTIASLLLVNLFLPISNILGLDQPYQPNSPHAIYTNSKNSMPSARNSRPFGGSYPLQGMFAQGFQQQFPSPYAQQPPFHSPYGQQQPAIHPSQQYSGRQRQVGAQRSADNPFNIPGARYRDHQPLIEDEDEDEIAGEDDRPEE